MQGVHILNTTEILDSPSWSLYLMYIGLIITIIGIICLIITIIIDYNTNKFDCEIIIKMVMMSCSAIFLGLIVALISATISQTVNIPTGRCQYEVTINDTVSFTELNDKYEVIEQRGKIWILEDKAESR